MNTTTPSCSGRLAWYLRSLADHDTHRGWLGGDGAVLALCGARFTPKPTVRVVGEPPGRLVDGPPNWRYPRSRSKCARRASVRGTAGEGGQASRSAGRVPLAPVIGPGCGPRAAAAGDRGGGRADEAGASGEPGGAGDRSPAGDFVALCGVRFQAASLVEPGRGRCGECAW